MTVYYNEIDPYAAQWLRNLIAAGLIAPGEVDERSIVDVRADELVGFTQCHFFAGIGAWSYALRLAGWPDERAVWTGSCPCQPFSPAGKRAGFQDERHLWPAWSRLIAERDPVTIFGEQVADGDGLAWLDAVQADLEARRYALGTVVLPAAGVGAPHGRHRIFFVADAERRPAERHGYGVGDAACGTEGSAPKRQRFRPDARDGGESIGLADAASLTDHQPDGQQLQRGWPGDAEHAGLGGDAGAVAHADQGGWRAGESQASPQGREQLQPAGGGEPCGLADTVSAGRAEGRAESGSGSVAGRGGTDGVGDADEQRREGQRLHVRARRSQQDRVEAARPGPTNGFWADADWLWCRDHAYRPVEPGTFPLAHGVAARMGRLRAYGNAINAEVAAAFIGAFMTGRPRFTPPAVESAGGSTERDGGGR